ncbi:MAG: steroid 5-alpha reductase family enzyme, partial [Bradymonadia bacterium]
MAERSNTDIAVAITIAISIGALVGWAGSDGGDCVGTVVPVFALCGALAFSINWLAFIPAVLKQTERYYDLVGGLTYISTTTVAVLLSSALDLRAMLVAAMVMVWSLRLATFLFRRILKSGKDSRFDAIKSRPPRFFMAWTLQGLWVLLTASAAWAVITGGAREPLGVVGIIGLAIWSIGIAIEIVADNQKSAFRRDPSNQGRFINTGLWSWSRHPNYFGEILLWAGMAIVALPVLHGWQYVTLISPVFVFFLLTRVSGVPLLE